MGSKGCADWKDFTGRRVGKGALDKRKRGVNFGLGIFSLGKREGRFLSCRLPLLSAGGQRGTMCHVTVPALGQKTPDWLMKVMFLGKAAAVLGSGVPSWFGVMGCSTRNSIQGPWGFLRLRVCVHCLWGVPAPGESPCGPVSHGFRGAA